MSINLKKFFPICFLIILFLSAFTLAQSKDVELLKRINNLDDTHQKIDSLKSFLTEFPESRYRTTVKYELFTEYLELGKTDSALKYADLLIKQIPPIARFNAYNDIAYNLGLKKVGLDTAEAYANRAVETARAGKMRILGSFLDTKALVMYDLGNADSALTLEEEAIVTHKNDPLYLNSLAIYQHATGKNSQAIYTAAEAIFLGNTDEPLTNFNKWIKIEKPDEKGQQKLKEEIGKKIISKYLSENKNEDKIKNRSNAAAFLANIGTNLPEANQWAKDALKTKNLTLEDKILYTRNYALVLNAEGKSDKALKELESVKYLTDPWDSNFWFTLGQIYEKKNEYKKASDAYITGSIEIKSPKIINALKNLEKEKGLTGNDINKRIKQKQAELADFKPGHFKENKNYKGKTILAELFTGAECPPCAGADYAFDALSEYYPRNIFTILEYHVHIPAPDPMTNPDSFKRYLYYGGNFGTPTVIIEGKEKITGGGPKFLAANRFHVYKFAAEKYLDEKPSIQISGWVKNKLEKVEVNLKIKSKKKSDKNASLHVALVEKSLNYPGGNGITKNIFVVRHLFNGAEGMPLKLVNGSEIVSDTLDLTKIENGLTKYLDNPTSYPSWRRSVTFTGWKEKTDKLNKNNLAVVAWVQNNSTKKVLQSYYIDVPGEESK